MIHLAKEDKYTWLKKRLQLLFDTGNKVKDASITNDYGCYTALKLISVARNPTRKTEGFDGAVYLDLFAGSGLVKLTETGD